MAILAAAKIFTPRSPIDRDLVRGVYTYGQPAVGDEDFAREFQKLFGGLLFRHVYHHDVVPHLPPRSTGKFGHFGFGEERYSESTQGQWRAGGPPHSNQAALLVAAALSTVADFVTHRVSRLGWPLPYSLDDHSPLRYIETSRRSL
jgi:hypothetical protein